MEYKSEPTEVVSILAQDETAVGVLPQPFATVACQQNDKLLLAADLTAEWDKTGNGSMVTGVTIAKKDFVEANPEIIDKFLDGHSASAEYANTSTAEAAELVCLPTESWKRLPLQKSASPVQYHLHGRNGDERGFKRLPERSFEQNPESVGGALPEDDFYYSR